MYISKDMGSKSYYTLDFSVRPFRIQKYYKCKQIPRVHNHY